MKPRHAAALALVVLASCAPDKAVIDAATQRAEAAASRAQKSAEIADQSASRAFDASVRALVSADLAEQGERRANDAVARMEAACGWIQSACESLAR